MTLDHLAISIISASAVYSVLLMVAFAAVYGIGLILGRIILEGGYERKCALEVEKWITPVNIAQMQIQTLLMIMSMGVTPLVKVQKIFGMMRTNILMICLK